MNRVKLICSLLLCLAPLSLFAQAGEPLRIFLRAGPKTHGPGQHDGPSWLADWKPLLAARGAKVDGAVGFPTAEQLENTDVLVMYSAEGGAIKPEQREYVDKFLKRGGGIVAIHDSVCGNDAQWFKTIIGGAWEHGHSKWFEGDVSIYYTDHSHPITRDVSNFDFDDEVYWDLHMMPEAKVLAATYAPDRRNSKGGRIYPSVYDIVPQMWVYEKELPGASAPHRAFVCIPGHMHKSFGLPHFRAVILRGIAWAGKREADSLCDKDELDSVRYPEGGPTAPEKAAAKLVVHPEFNISLVAAEPLINKPISLDWDAAGRLWVAETPEYPSGRRIHPNDKAIAAWKDNDPATFVGTKEQRPAHDRISILEDPDPQGRYRKKSVFYEGLELVTSLVLYRDGVIVSQAPDILWLRDTDGDGKADKVEKLFTGFGVGDTHAVISNLRWGMDGWVYATVGYSRGDISSGDGSKFFTRITEGVIRFKPDGSAFEQVASKGSNTWGMDFGPDGEIFFTQATSGDHINHVVMPESALARGKAGSTPSFKVIQDHRRTFPVMSWEKQAYVQIDQVGGFTAVAGSCFYTGGAWPAKYDNIHFCSDPTVNLVHADLITPSGISYLASKESGREEEEFIGSRDLWFRPIHSRVGPDGALYVVDFYNQAVVHNDTRGTPHGANNAAVRPDRDHYFGRIWRVQHKDAKELVVPKLDRATREVLAKALSHPNRWVRMTAQRMIIENASRDGAMHARETPRGLIQELAADQQAATSARIQALWTLQNIQAVNSRFLAKLMDDPVPAVRKNALQVVAEGAVDSTRVQTAGQAKDLKSMQQAALSRVGDAEPRVRLESLLALVAMDVDAATAKQVVEAYPDFKDGWLTSAAVGLASKAPLEFLNAVFASVNPGALKSFAAQITSQLIAKQDATISRDLVVSLAAQPARADGLKQTVLESLSKGLKAETIPPWTPELQKAFQSFLDSADPGLNAVAVAL